TLTAMGGYDNPYLYQVSGTTPDAPNIVVGNDGVVSVTSAFNNSQMLTVTVSIRVGELGNTEMLDEEMTIVVVPKLSLTVPATLRSTPNSSGVIGNATAFGGTSPYTIILQSVTPASSAANFVVSEAGEIRIQTAFPAFATATLALVLRDSLAREVTATVLVLVQENLAGGGLTGLGNLVIIGGYKSNGNAALTYRNDSWRSEDSTLTNWVSLPGGTYDDDYGYAVAVQAGSIYLVHNDSDGSESPLWASAASSKGTEWSNIATIPHSGERTFPYLTSYKNNLLLFGGVKSGLGQTDVWRSTTNGLNWSQLTADGLPSSAFDGASAVFNNVLYLITGVSSQHLWRSTNGSSWSRVSTHNGNVINILPASISRGASMAVFDDKLYIQYDNKLYYSSNGTNWSTVTLPSGFNSRGRANMLVYEDRLIILGGLGRNNNNYTSDTYNDIWASKTPTSANSWTEITDGSSLPWDTRASFGAVVIADTE
ncbi:MAG: hypothetical protein K0U19_07745, partial [Proteobacteria bacterium]|nr:hypothetical protein [Pseudomonadota bacterium]